MSSLLRDLRYSLRLLRRTPAFSAVAIGVLALGIGANTAVFSLVNTLLLRPRLGRIDQAVGVFSGDRTKPDSFRDFSYPAYVDLRDRSGVFESLMAHTFSLVGVRDGDTTRRTFASLVSANYFSTLGVSLAAGRTFTADEERPGAGVPVAIASYDVWRRAGFDPGSSDGPSASTRPTSPSSASRRRGSPARWRCCRRSTGFRSAPTTRSRTSCSGRGAAG